MHPISQGQSLSSARGTKRRLSDKCSFCGSEPSSVLVNLAPLGGKRKEKTPLCWLHYYTSRAVRSDEVELLDLENDVQGELNQSGLQDLFAEAFLELQQELATESAHAFEKQKADPLAILSSFRGKSKKPPPPPPREANVHRNGGGFMPNVPLPHRFQSDNTSIGSNVTRKSTPQQLTSSYQLSSDQNLSAKRKPSRKSIWKLAMELPSNAEAVTMECRTTCSCGSKSILTSGNFTSRAHEVPKAETWGFKDRCDEVVVRYQCETCGKSWNEEE